MTEQERFELDVSYLKRNGLGAQAGEHCRPSHAKAKTSLPRLDEMLGGGLVPGLHCVTGGPSSYKSALLLQVAYLAALDGRRVAYVTDEISSDECKRRLMARKIAVDAARAGGDPSETPSWAAIAERVEDAVTRGDRAAVGKYADALETVDDSPICILDMGDPIMDVKSGTRDFVMNTRYLASTMTEAPNSDWLDEALGYGCDLLVIDAVNSLRLFTYKYDESWDQWEAADHMPEPRVRMEQIVTALDNWSRKRGVVTIGVFHGNRTRGQGQQHPCMGDFKETSAIEYRAVSAWELVRADDMRWQNHPRAPKAHDGCEAVGLFLLKSRTGARTEQNRPIWLEADGAHNLVTPLG